MGELGGKFVFGCGCCVGEHLIGFVGGGCGGGGCSRMANPVVVVEGFGQKAGYAEG